MYAGDVTSGHEFDGRNATSLTVDSQQRSVRGGLQAAAGGTAQHYESGPLFEGGLQRGQLTVQHAQVVQAARVHMGLSEYLKDGLFTRDARQHLGAEQMCLSLALEFDDAPLLTERCYHG